MLLTARGMEATEMVEIFHETEAEIVGLAD